MDPDKIVALIAELLCDEEWHAADCRIEEYRAWLENGGYPARIANVAKELSR